MASPVAAAKAPEKKPAKSVERDVGFGGGVFTVFPPMITLDGSYTWKALTGGLAAGYLNAPIGEFEGTSTYVGLDGRYQLTSGGWYGGLSIGRRTFDITTYNDLTVGTTTTTVAWRRKVSQTLIYPKVGWSSTSKAGHTLVVAGGVAIPTGTSFSMEKDPEFISGGLTQAELDSEEEARADDVKQVTNKAWPSLELKYVHIFDLVK